MRKASVLTPDELRRAARQKAQEAFNRLDPQLRRNLNIPSDLTRGIAEVKKTASERILADNRFKMGEILAKQTGMAHTLLEYGKSSSIEKVIANTTKDADILDLNSDQLGEYMSGLVDHITYNNKALADRMSSLGKKISQGDLTALNEDKKDADAFTERVVTNEEVREILSKDELPEIIEN